MTAKTLPQKLATLAILTGITADSPLQDITRYVGRCAQLWDELSPDELVEIYELIMNNS